MKNVLFSLFVISTLYLPHSLAQDYTQWELPEDAIARLGKGRINDMRYSPDGTVLAVATTIGIWLYDTDVYQERALLLQDRKDVEKIKFTPDGKTIASADGYSDITHWNVGTRKPKNTFTDGSAIYRNILFSPDGQIFAYETFKEIYLWDMVSGESKHILKEHSDFVTSISFSPDGKTLASGSKDQSIRFWDVATGTLKQTLTVHPAGITNVAFSPDGSTLTSVDEDKSIFLWDTTSGEHKITLADKGLITKQIAKQETIENTFFSTDGSILATVKFDNTIRLWDTTTGTLIQTFPTPDTDIKQKDHLDKTEKIMFSPDNRIVVSIIAGGIIRLWDIATGKRKHLSEKTGYVKNAVFSPDMRTLVTDVYGGTIRIWDVATGKQKKTIFNLSISRSGMPIYRENKTYSLNGEMFAAGQREGTVYLWNTNTRQQQLRPGQFNHAKGLSINNVLISPEGKTLASWNSYDDHTIRLWDTATGKQIRKLVGHNNYIKPVTFSPDGSTLASWGSNNETTIRLWHVATGKPKHNLKGHTQTVESVTFSSDGKTLASGGLDGTIRIWNADSGKQIHAFMEQRFANNLAAQSAAINVVTFNTDGNVLASGHKNGSIRLWDINSGYSIQTLKGHADAISTLSFSPDGHTIASTSKDATVRLWDIATGKQEQALAAYQKTIWHVKFYPNGLVLASDIKGEIGGSDDESIRLWDLRTGHLKKTLTGHASWVVDISFSGDGKTLSSLSFDNTTLLWDLTSLIKDIDVTE